MRTHVSGGDDMAAQSGTAGRSGVDVGAGGEVGADPRRAQASEPRRGQLSVESGSGWFRLLGGPGTGKTRALRRTLAAGTRRWGPERVLGLAHNRAAARRWQIQVATDVSGAAPTALTFHSLSLRLAPIDVPGRNLRLLTGPEQDTHVRQVLEGSRGLAGVPWPVEWKDALTTRSFVTQLRRAMARIRTLGLDPQQVQLWADRQGDSGWAAVASFTQEYLDVLGWEGATDYTEQLVRACANVRDSEAPPLPWDLMVVDEAQDLDPLQWRLLSALAARIGNGVVAGDPQQSTLGFRGADPGLLASGDGLPAHECVTLYRSHRMPLLVRDTTIAIGGGYRAAGAPAGEQLLTPIPSDGRHGSRTLLCYDGPVQAAAHLAARLRAKHAAGARWSDMAVLWRRPDAQATTLLEALRSTGIPHRVRSGATTLAEQPAVALLLRAAALALRFSPPGTGVTREVPGARAAEVSGTEFKVGGAGPGAAGLSESEVEDLLLSPIVDCPAAEVRALGAALRTVGSGLVSGLQDPGVVQMLPTELRRAGRTLVSVGDMLARAADACDAPALALWHLWQGPHRARHRPPGTRRWPERLLADSMSESPRAQSADADLDGVTSLFRWAERAPSRWQGHRDLASFLDDLRSEAVAAEPDVRVARDRDAVWVGSAHDVKGMQWSFVGLWGVDDSLWPGRDVGSGLLNPERLLVDQLLPAAPTGHVGLERRLLFHAAGRAEDELHMALWVQPDGSERPSRFLADLPVERCSGPPATTGTPWELIAELREGTQSAVPEERLRAAAALRRLRDATDADGSPLLAAADPGLWPHARPWTTGCGPIRPQNAPLVLSPSALASISECSRRWFLEREVPGSTPGVSTAATFGTAVHEAAALLVESEERGAVLTAAEVVSQMLANADGYEAQWHWEQDRALVAEAVERAARWISSRPGRLRAEVDVDVNLPSGQDEVRVRGSIDVLEVAVDGTALVWDYKTRRSRTSAREVREHVQLAAYSAAVNSGSVDGATSSRGAGLVHLCVPSGTRAPQEPLQVEQAGLQAHVIAAEALATARDTIRSEEFPARPGRWCGHCPVAGGCPTRSTS